MTAEPITISYGAGRYRFQGMPAQTETRILRRLAPFAATAVRALVRNPTKPGETVRLRADHDRVKLWSAALDAYGALADADTDLIERACLGALVRERDGQWVPVWPEGEPVPAFADIDGALMLRLVLAVCGFVVNGWCEGAGERVPPELRAFVSTLH